MAEPAAASRNPVAQRMVPGLRFAFGRPLVLLLVFTAVLFACFAIDPLRVLDDAQHEVFSDGGLRLVRQRILSTTPETPFLYPGVTSPEQTRLYLSQAGLPGILAAWAAPETQEARLVFLERLAVLVAFLTAFVLAAFFASAAEHFGLIPTAIAVLLTCMSPHLLGFSRSLFFSPFLFFIPFVISWLLYPGWVRERQHVFAFHLLIAAAVAVKCLSGYEYFTTTAVGAIVPVIYFEWDRLERWRAPVLQSLKVLVAGAAGFFVAITLHGLQLYHLFGREGVAVILDRATQRTVGDTRTADQLYAAYEKLLGKLPPDSLVHRIAESLNETLLIGSGVFSRYFLLPAINLPGSQEGRMERVDVYVPIGLVVLLVFAVVAWLLRRGVDLENRKHRLALVTALSLLAPLSWQILAFGHMIPHIGLNSIVFYVPFLILAYLLLGCVVASLARSLPMRL